MQTGMAVKNMLGSGGGLFRAASSTATGFGARALGGVGSAALAGGGGYLAAAGGLNIANWGAKKVGLINDDEHFMESDVGKVAGFGGGIALGAATGAIVGSVVPVLGTAIGAVAGGVIGGIGGLIAAWFENEEANEVKSAREKKNQMLALRDRANEQDLIASGATGASEAKKQEAAFIKSEIIPLEAELAEARQAGDAKQIEYLQKKLDFNNRNLAEMQEQNNKAQALLDIRKKVWEADNKNLETLTQYTIRLKSVEERYKIQVDLLNSQKAILDSFIGFFGMTQNLTGGFGSALGENLDEFRRRLDEAKKANDEYMKVIRQ
jgi:hypothetical protein